MLCRSFLTATGAAVIAASFGAPAVLGQDTYPREAIEFIVPFAPGGGSDMLMRIVANHLSEELGQPVPVINIAGASGTIGLEQAAEEEPDGYTIAQINDGLLISSQTGLTDLNWDHFTPVALITSSPQFVVVRADSPWQTFDEFVTYAKENPGAVNFGVTLASVSHLHGAMIEDATGTEFSYVGFEGSGDRIRGLLSGTVDAAIGDVAAAGQFVENGDFRFLAVGSDERQPDYPDVPTLQELGHDLELSVTRGVVAPKGTPQERVEVLEEALSKVAEDREATQQMQNAGGLIDFRDQEAYTNFLETLEKTVERLSPKLAP